MSRSLGLGGSERQIAAIARALDRTVFSPRIGCFRPEGMRVAELERDGVPVVPFPVRSFRSPYVLRVARQLIRYVRQENIQVVHTFDFPTTLFVAPLARSLRPALFLSSQRSHRELTPGLTHWLLRLTDRAAAAIVVNCESVHRHMAQDEHVPAARLELCYNGIDTAEFFPRQDPRPEPLHNAWLVIGAVCGLRPEKDLGTLLSAFATLPSEPGLQLALVGDGSEREVLGAQANQLGIASRVHFIPGNAAVPRWLRAIDIFVLPSVSEALSNSLMEAMACGCCPVASRIGGNPELLEERVSGRLFRAGDVPGLAAVLRDLIVDSAQRLRLADAAAQSIAQHFRLEDSARAMGAIYTRLLQRDAGSPLPTP